MAIATWCSPTATTCPRTRPFCGTRTSLTLDGRTVLARSCGECEIRNGSSIGEAGLCESSRGRDLRFVCGERMLPLLAGRLANVVARIAFRFALRGFVQRAKARG